MAKPKGMIVCGVLLTGLSVGCNQDSGRHGETDLSVKKESFLSQDTAVSLATAHLRDKNLLPLEFEVDARETAGGWTVIFWKLPRKPDAHVFVQVSGREDVRVLDPRDP